jgi:hypothetical protein
MILFGVDGMAAAKKPNSQQYHDNYDKIFNKDEQESKEVQEGNKEEKNSEGEEKKITDIKGVV